ncbi:exonuclease [Sporocytophaga myxococcoides]|uniref:exonuclease n=1 Tax=Sporocytophaga myxococcoides TaxID=153721 RepID=UPI00041C22FD|nr:exonuclease [Sporocytophaga myxococcoides]
MGLIIVDVEADGPIPGKYSMVCFGAIVVEPSLSKTFYGKVKPVSGEWIPEALAVSGFSREEHSLFDEPHVVMSSFELWLKENVKGKPVFLSDNLAFDWQWINYYFHYYLGRNPFGFSGRRIGDLYSGMIGDIMKGSEWKKFRMTRHTHNPVDDARGNAEAMLKLREMGLKFPFK